MNRVYKVVWNIDLQCMQVTSELTCARSGRDDRAILAARPIRWRPLSVAIMGAALCWSGMASAQEGVVLDGTPDGTPGYVGYELPNTHLIIEGQTAPPHIENLPRGEFPIGGFSRGGDGVVIKSASNSSIDNVTLENWEVTGGNGEYHVADGGRWIYARRAGNGGDGLVFNSSDKKRNLTISRGNVITGGTGGYAMGTGMAPRSLGAAGSHRDDEGFYHGEDSIGGEGGGNRITANQVINLGQLLGGRGGKSEAGDATDIGSELEPLPGAIGGIGTGGKGGGLFFDVEALFNEEGALIAGGTGGVGIGGSTDAYISGTGGLGVGGAGGGIEFVAGSLDNHALVSGGAGGDGIGGDGGFAGQAIGGQGAGMDFAGVAMRNAATGIISGGRGGDAFGGEFIPPHDIDGTRPGNAIGGQGGVALSINSDNAELRNEGQIIGGAGGNATTGEAAYFPAREEVGGAGGNGMVIAGDGNTLLNTASATISGGAGGLYQSNPDETQTFLVNGKGGVGVLVTGDHNSITNYGQINGGMGDIWSVEDLEYQMRSAEAIRIEGRDNTITLEAGAEVNGDIRLIGGGNSLVSMGGAINGSLELGSGDDMLSIYGHLDVRDQILLNNGLLNIAGVSETSGSMHVLNALGGISGSFNPGGILIGGMSASETDFLAQVGASMPDAQTLNVDYELSWNNSNASAAHGDFTLSNPDGSFIVGAALTTQTANANWDGDSLTKRGEGTLVLDGVNTYTGLTDVTQGSLIVGRTSANNDAQVAGAVDVQSGATLGGHGGILGHVNLLDGATLAPGNSIGTITVDSITFNPGSTYEFEANPDGTADKVNVTTSATIDGGHVAVLAGSGLWGASTPYTILTAGASVTGTFDSVASDLAFLAPELTYDPNNVYLTLTRNDIAFDNPSVAVTYNQRNAAAAIEGLGTGNAVYNAIVGLDAETARAAYDNLSGEIHASVRGALFQNSRYLRDALVTRLDRAAVADADVQGVRGWISGWGHQAETKSDGNATKTKVDGAGLALGGDLALGETARVGAALGQENSKVKAHGRHSNAETESLHVALYGGVALGPVELKAGVAYSDVDVTTKRNVWVQSVESRNAAKYDAEVTQAFLEAGHTFWAGSRASLMPYLNVAYVHVKTDGATENASPSSLRVKGESDDVTYTTLGLRSQLELKGGLNLYGDLAWQHAFGDVDTESWNRFVAGGDAFKARGVPLAENSIVIGLGLNWDLSKKSHLSVGYQGQLGDDVTDHSAHLRFNYRF